MIECFNQFIDYIDNFIDNTTNEDYHLINKNK
jgi:hypothetical protein